MQMGSKSGGMGADGFVLFASRVVGIYSVMRGGAVWSGCGLAVLGSLSGRVDGQWKVDAPRRSKLGTGTKL